METVFTDVLVIGGGGAGSRAAYEAKRFGRELEVTLVVGGCFGESGSTTFVGSETLGINAPLGVADPADNPETYLADMVETGLGLSNQRLCAVIAHEANDRVRELIDLGVPFDRKDGRLVQRKLSGCTRPRSLACGGQTGVQIVRALKRACQRLGVAVYENTRAVDLLKRDDRVAGAVCLSRDGSPLLIQAQAVVLACGGAGRLFRGNINPPGINGDGFAMAYRAGATLTNMEFIQVGPGVVFPPVRFIIHSHMWRFLPRLLNKDGDEFLRRYCPDGLSPHDVLDLKAMSYPFSVRTAAKYLDIAVFKELLAGRGTEHGGVYFDATHVPRVEFETRAPVTYETFLKSGVDLATDRIEIAPVVQSFNGGVRIDENGATDVPGLYCAGEVSGGVHGADRPGGNNLIDSQVFGYRAGTSAAREALGAGRGGDKLKLELTALAADGGTQYLEQDEGDQQVLAELRELYYKHLTIVRNEEGLRTVLARIEDLKDVLLSRDDYRRHVTLANALCVGEMIARSALVRRESRGTHYRDDCPDSDPRYLDNTVAYRGDGWEVHVGWSAAARRPALEPGAGQ